MAWRRTRTTASGKVRHTGLYRDPHGETRSAGTFSRAKDAQNAADAQETLVKLGTWIDPTSPSCRRLNRRCAGTSTLRSTLLRSRDLRWQPTPGRHA